MKSILIIMGLGSQLVFLSSCSEKEKSKDESQKPAEAAVADSARQITDYLALPSFAANGNLHAVIEIPAGTNHKYEYDKESKAFKVNQAGGKKRVVNYLSYPLNYGFIPSTYMDKAKGGDGDPLDVLVISESLKTGTVLEVIPVALLVMTDKGEQDHKVLAIPADTALRILTVSDYNDLTSRYPSIKSILETWFANYDPGDPKEMQGWKNEREAVSEAQKWSINKP